MSFVEGVTCDTFPHEPDSGTPPPRLVEGGLARSTCTPPADAISARVPDSGRVLRHRGEAAQLAYRGIVERPGAMPKRRERDTSMLTTIITPSPVPSMVSEPP